MKTRHAWIVTGALGAVGLGATAAAAQGMFATPDDGVVSSAVQVGDGAGSDDAADGSGRSASPSDVQNGSSVTTVTPGSAPSATTAPTSHTPTSPASPVSATTPVSPVTPQSAQTAQSAQSAQTAQSAQSAQTAQSAPSAD